MIPVEEYYKRINTISEKNFSDISQEKSNYYQALFSVVSCNLFQLIPSLPVERHWDTFKSIINYQSWAAIDQYYPELVKEINVVDHTDTLKNMSHSNYIYCCFHTGSYRLVPLLLFSMGINLTLLIDDTVAQAQSANFYKVSEMIKQQKNLKNKFTIITAGSNAAGIRLIKELKMGNSLFIYIDGNTGQGGAYRKDEKMTKVDFLNKNIFVRKGVGYLSHATQIPIVPVIANRESNYGNTITLFDPICADASESREEYCQRSVQQLYNIAEKKIFQYPEQWESWRYIDKCLDLSDIKAPVFSVDPGVLNSDRTLIRFNAERFVIFAGDNNKFFMLDRCTYRSFHISQPFYSFLIKLQTAVTIGAAKDIVSRTTLKALLDKGALELV